MIKYEKKTHSGHIDRTKEFLMDLTMLTEDEEYLPTTTEHKTNIEEHQRMRFAPCPSGLSIQV